MELFGRIPVDADVNSEREPLQEKCGIAVVYSPQPQNLFPIALKAAGGVQHRGQNGTGYAHCLENGSLNALTGSGLVREVFTDNIVASSNLNAPSFWGGIHCRYGTNGGYNELNNQPCVVNNVAVFHNGEFAAVDKIREQLTAMGIEVPNGASDTYIFTQLLAHADENNWEEKILNTLDKVTGSYSLAIGVGPNLYLARDPLGIRPFFLGKVDDKLVAASETHALDKVDTESIREIRRGEIIRISPEGATIIREGREGNGYFCAFEKAYFERPDSLIPLYDNTGEVLPVADWQSVWDFRTRCGIVLAKEAPVKNASFVVGIPDSGIPVATGYAVALDKPYQQLIIRDHYDADGDKRVFMHDQNKDTMRSKVIGKLSFVPGRMWKDAVVIAVDDSIVRGKVSQPLTETMFRLGAKEVHWVIGFPAVSYPCHLGVSTRHQNELIAARHEGNPVKIAQEIGATAVHYISPQGFIRASGGDIVVPARAQEIFLANGLCGGCINGTYPIYRDGRTHNIFSLPKSGRLQRSGLLAAH